MLHVLLATLGSAGDLHPYVALGRALARRGHRVTLVTHGYYEPLVRRAGLGYAELAPAGEFLALTRERRLTSVRVAFRLVAERAVVPFTRRLYRIIEERHEPGRTVVVANALAFGARLAQEKLGVPLATVHIYPFDFRSLHASPHFPRWLPRALKRLGYRALDAVVDRRLAPATNAFRAELGLAPVARLLAQWWQSPRRILGLFPEWFGPPQPDWPPQTLLTGFPLYDESCVLAVPPGAERFLDAGEPPIVFATASWMQHAARFFEASAEACARLGRRGLLLTAFPQQLPARLPDGVRHFESIPYAWLLPRAAAFVHHGGIGSVSSALAAGVPQLVTPLILDQPDNAARLRGLGVAATLQPRAYRAPAAAAALERLLASPAVAARCRELARRLEASRGVEAACLAIETLAEDA